jgi:hypothetical protein
VNRRARATVHQRRLPDRQQARRCRLPGRADRVATRGQGRTGRPVRTGVPAVRALHHRIDRADYRSRPARAATRRRPRAPNRSGVAGRLPSHSPEDRAEDRPFDATPARRHTCPCPRPREGERGLQSPRRRGQSRPSRHARGHHPPPLCCHERLKHHTARKPVQAALTKPNRDNSRRDTPARPHDIIAPARSQPGLARPITARSAQNGRFTSPS